MTSARIRVSSQLLLVLLALFLGLAADTALAQELYRKSPTTTFCVNCNHHTTGQQRQPGLCTSAKDANRYFVVYFNADATSRSLLVLGMTENPTNYDALLAAPGNPQTVYSDSFIESVNTPRCTCTYGGQCYAVWYHSTQGHAYLMHFSDASTPVPSGSAIDIIASGSPGSQSFPFGVTINGNRWVVGLLDGAHSPAMFGLQQLYGVTSSVTRIGTALIMDSLDDGSCTSQDMVRGDSYGDFVAFAGRSDCSHGASNFRIHLRCFNYTTETPAPLGNTLVVDPSYQGYMPDIGLLSNGFGMVVYRDGDSSGASPRYATDTCLVANIFNWEDVTLKSAVGGFQITDTGTSCTTAGGRPGPSVAAIGQTWIVVWAGQDVFELRAALFLFDPSSAPYAAQVGASIQIDPVNPTFRNFEPEVRFTSLKRAAVSYHSEDTDKGDNDAGFIAASGIDVRVIPSAGTPKPLAAAPTEISTTYPYHASLCSDAHAADGRFMIVWQSAIGGPGGLRDIWSNIYDTTGSAVFGGNVMTQDTDGSSSQENPDCARLVSGGDWVVVYSNTDEGGDWGIYRVVIGNSNGGLLGGAPYSQRVNTITTDPQSSGNVAPLPNGGYAVAYLSGPYTQEKIMMQLYEGAAHQKQGSEITVSVYHGTGRNWFTKDAVSFEHGRLSVAWETASNNPDDASSSGCALRVYSVSGFTLTDFGSELIMNKLDTGGSQESCGFALSPSSSTAPGMGAWGTGGGYVYAQVINMTGSAPIHSGTPVLVNSETYEFQTNPPRPSVAAVGKFFVVVFDAPQATNKLVRGQVITPSGNLYGNNFFLSDKKSPYMIHASVVSLDHANFKFATQYSDQSIHGTGIVKPFLRTFQIRTTATVTEGRKAAEVTTRSTVPQGTFLTDDMPITEAPTGDQQRPSLCAQTKYCSYLVVWETWGVSFDVGARVFNAQTKEPLGPTRILNTYTTGNQMWPQCAAASNVNQYVVVWGSDGQIGAGNEIYGAVVSGRDGYVIGSDILLNALTSGDQWYPDVAALPGNKFVVTWYDTNNKIYAQLYDTTLTKIPAANELEVESVSCNSHGPVVATIGAITAVAYVTGCTELANALPTRQVVAKFLDLSGSTMSWYTDQWLVLSDMELIDTTNAGYHLDVTGIDDASGSGLQVFLAVFKSSNPRADGDMEGILGQFFDTLGNKIGNNFVVNYNRPLYQQRFPAVTSYGPYWAVTWTGNSDNSLTTIADDVYLQMGNGLMMTGCNEKLNSYSKLQQWLPRVTFVTPNTVVGAWHSRDVARSYDTNGDSLHQVFFETTAPADYKCLGNTRTPTDSATREPTDTATDTPSPSPSFSKTSSAPATPSETFSPSGATPSVSNSAVTPSISVSDDTSSSTTSKTHSLSPSRGSPSATATASASGNTRSISRGTGTSSPSTSLSDSATVTPPPTPTATDSYTVTPPPTPTKSHSATTTWTVSAIRTITMSGDTETKTASFTTTLSKSTTGTQGTRTFSLPLTFSAALTASRSLIPTASNEITATLSTSATLSLPPSGCAAFSTPAKCWGSALATPECYWSQSWNHCMNISIHASFLPPDSVDAVVAPTELGPAQPITYKLFGGEYLGNSRLVLIPKSALSCPAADATVWDGDVATGWGSKTVPYFFDVADSNMTRKEGSRDACVRMSDASKTVVRLGTNSTWTQNPSAWIGSCAFKPNIIYQNTPFEVLFFGYNMRNSDTFGVVEKDQPCSEAVYISTRSTASNGQESTGRNEVTLKGEYKVCYKGAQEGFVPLECPELLASEGLAPYLDPYVLRNASDRAPRIRGETIESINKRLCSSGSVLNHIFPANPTGQPMLHPTEMQAEFGSLASPFGLNEVCVFLVEPMASPEHDTHPALDIQLSLQYMDATDKVLTFVPKASFPPGEVPQDVADTHPSTFAPECVAALDGYILVAVDARTEGVGSAASTAAVSHRMPVGSGAIVMACSDSTRRGGLSLGISYSLAETLCKNDCRDTTGVRRGVCQSNRQCSCNQNYGGEDCSQFLGCPGTGADAYQFHKTAGEISFYHSLPPTSICGYSITALPSANQQKVGIGLRFTDITLESLDCDSNFLQVRKGDSQGPVLQRYCANQKTPEAELLIDTSTIYFEFSGTAVNDGFAFQFVGVELNCPGVKSRGGVVLPKDECSGKGRCVSADYKRSSLTSPVLPTSYKQCACIKPFGASTPQASCDVCVKGFVNYPNCSRVKQCPNNCSFPLQGQCDEDAGVCRCFPGYFGKSCGGKVIQVEADASLQMRIPFDNATGGEMRSHGGIDPTVLSCENEADRCLSVTRNRGKLIEDLTALKVASQQTSSSSSSSSSTTLTPPPSTAQQQQGRSFASLQNSSTANFSLPTNSSAPQIQQEEGDSALLINRMITPGSIGDLVIRRNIAATSFDIAEDFTVSAWVQITSDTNGFLVAKTDDLFHGDNRCPALDLGTFDAQDRHRPQELLKLPATDAAVYFGVYINGAQKRVDVLFMDPEKQKNHNSSAPLAISEWHTVRHFRLGSTADVLFDGSWRFLALAFGKVGGQIEGRAYVDGKSALADSDFIQCFPFLPPKVRSNLNTSATIRSLNDPLVVTESSSGALVIGYGYTGALDEFRLYDKFVDHVTIVNIGGPDFLKELFVSTTTLVIVGIAGLVCVTFVIATTTGSFLRKRRLRKKQEKVQCTQQERNEKLRRKRLKAKAKAMGIEFDGEEGEEESDEGEDAAEAIRNLSVKQIAQTYFSDGDFTDESLEFSTDDEEIRALNEESDSENPLLILSGKASLEQSRLAKSDLRMSTIDVDFGKSSRRNDTEVEKEDGQQDLTTATAAVPVAANAEEEYVDSRSVEEVIANENENNTAAAAAAAAALAPAPATGTAEEAEGVAATDPSPGERSPEPEPEGVEVEEPEPNGQQHEVAGEEHQQAAQRPKLADKKLPKPRDPRTWGYFLNGPEGKKEEKLQNLERWLCKRYGIPLRKTTVRHLRSQEKVIEDVHVQSICSHAAAAYGSGPDWIENFQIHSQLYHLESTRLCKTKAEEERLEGVYRYLLHKAQWQDSHKGHEEDIAEEFPEFETFSEIVDQNKVLLKRHIKYQTGSSKEKYQLLLDAFVLAAIEEPQDVHENRQLVRRVAAMLKTQNKHIVKNAAVVASAAQMGHQSIAGANREQQNANTNASVAIQMKNSSAASPPPPPPRPSPQSLSERVDSILQHLRDHQFSMRLMIIRDFWQVVALLTAGMSWPFAFTNVWGRLASLFSVSVDVAIEVHFEVNFMVCFVLAGLSLLVFVVIVWVDSRKTSKYFIQRLKTQHAFMTKELEKQLLAEKEGGAKNKKKSTPSSKFKIKTSAKENICTVALIVLNTVYLPATRNAIVAVSCHRSILCLYDCYNEPTHNLLVILGVLQLIFITVGVPVVLGLITLKKQREFSDVVGVIESSSKKGALWTKYLKVDSSPYKSIYEGYVQTFAQFQCVLIGAKALICVVTLGTTPNSVGQLIAVVVIQSLFTILFGGASPMRLAVSNLLMVVTQSIIVVILACNALYRANPDELEDVYTLVFHVVGTFTLISQFIGFFAPSN